MSVAVGDFSQEVTSENPTGEEKLFIDKIGERCFRQREQQVQNQEAGASSQCWRETEGGKCGESCRKREKRGQII